MSNETTVAIAAIITILLQAGKRFAPQIKGRVPAKYQWATPILAGVLSALLVELQSGQALKDAAMRAALEGLAIGLGAMGIDAGLSNSPLPWSNKRGNDDDDDQAPPIHIIGLVLCVSLVLGCDFQQHAKTAQEAARHACAVYRSDVEAIPEHEAADKFCATEEQLRAWKEAGER